MVVKAVVQEELVRQEVQEAEAVERTVMDAKAVVHLVEVVKAVGLEVWMGAGSAAGSAVVSGAAMAEAERVMVVKEVASGVEMTVVMV